MNIEASYKKNVRSLMKIPRSKSILSALYFPPGQMLSAPSCIVIR